jgi:hypothetical protein
MVLELMIAGKASTRGIIFKVHKSIPHESTPAKERAHREYDILGQLKSLFSKFQADDVVRSDISQECRFDVPRPLHLDEHIPAVVMDTCQGRPLVDYLKQGRFTRNEQKVNALKRILIQAGRWLKFFQDCTRENKGAIAYMDTMIEQARTDLKTAEAWALHARDAQIISKRIETLRERIDLSSLVVCGHHGDFWPGNIYVDKNRITVIDFEGFRQGLSLEDCANFIVHLELFFSYPTLRKRKIIMTSAFLKGYLHTNTHEQNLLVLCIVVKALRMLAQTHLNQDLSFFQRWRHRKVLRDVCLETDKY